MEKVKIHRLKLGKDYVGYRVEAYSCNGNNVFFDVPDDLFNVFVKLFHTSKIYKGRVIVGRDIDGRFVSDNEANVHEVSSLAEGQALLNRYYFEFLEGGLEPAKVGDLSMYPDRDEYLRSFSDGRISNVAGCKYWNFGQVKEVYNLLVKAIKDTHCSIVHSVKQSEDKGYLILNVIFKEFGSGLRFVHNLMCLLNIDAWTPTMEVCWEDFDCDLEKRKYHFTRVNNADVFGDTLLSKIGVRWGEALPCYEFAVHGSDGMAKLGTWGDSLVKLVFSTPPSSYGDFHCFSYHVPIPGKNDINADGNDPKYSVKWAIPKKSRRALSVPSNRCADIISAFIHDNFDNVDGDAVDSLIKIGFNGVDLYNNFGVSVDAYAEWLENIGYEGDDLQEALKERNRHSVTISNDRYMSMLNIIIDYVYANEDCPINYLMSIGFTKEELVNVFTLDV